LGEITQDYEIIFSMDPSPDRTEEVVLEERLTDPRIKLLKFSRRFGQPMATLAGMEYSRGDAVIVFTPDNTHFAIASAAVARGLHVLVAKPVVKTLAEHAALAAEERRAHAPAQALHATPDEVARTLATLPRVVSDEHAAGAIRVVSRAPELHATRLLREEKGFAALAERLRGWTAAGRRTALVVGNAAQAERLTRILEGQDVVLPAYGASLPAALADHGGPGPFVIEGELTGSIEFPADGLVCIAESNLFGEHRHGRRRKAVALTLDQVMRSLEQLAPDDYIVHVDHGIGLYRGLRHMTVTGTEGDFLDLEYQGGDRLYLPVDRVNLVQKYVGGDGARPLLDKLGGVAWERLKAKAKESILAMAHELLALYARRTAASHSCSPKDFDSA
jgi:transcription-repair coupling factor (superfamily II helicase)